MTIRRGEIPEAWEAARRSIVERLDDLTNVLDRGFKSRDQLRDVRDVEIDTGSLPLDVLVRGFSAPLAVMMLRATLSPLPDGQVVSGGAVTWEWRDGAIRIHALDGLAASTRYLVTLAVVE